MLDRCFRSVATFPAAPQQERERPECWVLLPLGFGDAAFSECLMEMLCVAKLTGHKRHTIAVFMRRSAHGFVR